MRVEEAGAGDPACDSPSPAAVVGYNDPSARSATEHGGSLADANLALMHVDHIGPSKSAHDPRREGIMPATACRPTSAEDLDLEGPEDHLLIARPERQQPRWYVLGHVAREFQGVPLSTSRNPPAGVEDCGCQVQHSRVRPHCHLAVVTITRNE
jgi:hypothetical protein